MTFSEMHERVDVQLDKHDVPWFEPEEKDIWLNFALNEIVKVRYKEFEKNEKRREDIRTLVTTLTGSGATVAIPSNFMFALSLKGTFDVVECGISKVVERFIRPIQHDDVNKIKGDPFNSPSNFHPIYTSTEISYEIDSDSSPSAWTLTYIREPVPIDGTNNGSQSSNLPKYMHEEVVNVAVRKILGSIEKQNYPVQVSETKTQE